MTTNGTPAVLGEIPVAPPSPVGTTATSTRQIDETSATRESDAQILRSAGQRRINMVWEFTQACIAISVIGTVLFVNARLAIGGFQVGESSTSAVTQLDVLAGIVIGFYFGRTNHQRVGGVGGDANSTR